MMTTANQKCHEIKGMQNHYNSRANNSLSLATKLKVEVSSSVAHCMRSFPCVPFDLTVALCVHVSGRLNKPFIVVVQVFSAHPSPMPPGFSVL